LFLILKGRKNKNEIEIDWKELNESAPWPRLDMLCTGHTLWKT
jgi:hypothetical protein